MTQHDNILIVPVPKGRDWYFMNDLICFFNDNDNDVWIDLPPGPWRTVGRAKELTEGQWRGVVPVLPSGIRWANYEHPERLLLSATESGMSLLRSHGIDPESNPIILIKQK